MSEIEQMLRRAGAAADWPPTPDLATAVVPRLEGLTDLRTGDTPRRLRSLPARRAAALAFAMLLVLAASALAVPAVRHWLGFGAVRIQRVPRPLPAVRGGQLALGSHTTLAAARARLGFAPIVPKGFGRPTVWYDRVPAGGQLGLVYPGGIIVTEVQGRLQARYLTKFLPPGTKADAVLAGSDPALWIHGALHQYAFTDRNGRIRTDSVRTAGTVLLVRHGDLLVRIEGARSRAQAVAIAASARAAP
ncbi:MAG: hypothetical protein QOC55_1741 [Thermoleophilaceae bacterium]|nr:hypothetical protein [Thermoleophilaceae bacterium]